jgi:PAS domain-containing protein
MRNLQAELLIGALENARFGVCVVDESARIVMANPAFAAKLGTEVSHILGQSYLCLFKMLGSRATRERCAANFTCAIPLAASPHLESRHAAAGHCLDANLGCCVGQISAP